MKLKNHIDRFYTEKEQKELKMLSYTYSDLTSLEGIETLISLEVFDCSYNQLTDLKGIENLTYLKKLYCSNNQLTTLIGIENLTFLKELYCYNNPLLYKYSNNLQDILKEIKIEKRKKIINSLCH